MTARTGTIPTAAIVCALLMARSVTAQESIPAARDAAKEKYTAQVQALERAQRQQRAEILNALELERNRIRVEQEAMLVDLLFANLEREVDPHAPLRERGIQLQHAIERMVNRIALGALDPRSARTTFTRHLDTELSAARRTMGLTAAQESKLRLAAEGDMKRYFDEVAFARDKFVAAFNEPARKKELSGEVQRLRAINLAGPFGQGSLYAKVLNRIRRERGVAGQ